MSIIKNRSKYEEAHKKEVIKAYRQATSGGKTCSYKTIAILGNVSPSTVYVWVNDYRRDRLLVTVKGKNLLHKGIMYVPKYEVIS